MPRLSRRLSYTGISAPGRIDARRCISYLTIEHKGMIIGAEFRAAMGNRIYGCDDCLAACPWNKFAQTAREMKLQPRPELAAPRLDFCWGWTTPHSAVSSPARRSSGSGETASSAIA